MHRSRRNVSEILQEQYSDLVKTLPMDDEIFIADLYTNELLPGDLRNEIKSLPTSAKKASKFLDKVIEPSVKDNSSVILNTLLTVMKKSGNSVVIQLAENIQSMTNTLLSSSRTGL